MKKPEQDKAGYCGRPLCPFCSKPWSDDMVRVYDVVTSAGCETCGYGSTVEATIDITCNSCNRLIYRKQGYIKD